MEYDEWRSALLASTNDERQIASRWSAARDVSTAFESIGRTLHVYGHIIGPDRQNGASPFRHGSDDIVAFSRLLLIASQLLSAASDLINGARPYAGAALIRQLVEVEYLVSAFVEAKDDAKYWLRSDRAQRIKFFSPSVLRKKAGGRFRDKDYVMHCERGGHPVPDCLRLLNDEERESQIILSDALLHAESILFFAERFCQGNKIPLPASFADSCAIFSDWRKVDDVTRLYLSPHNQDAGEPS